jgi:hypothetical protein
MNAPLRTDRQDFLTQAVFSGDRRLLPHQIKQDLFVEYAGGPPRIGVFESFDEADCRLELFEKMEQPFRLFEYNKAGWGTEVDIDALRADAARRIDEAQKRDGAVRLLPKNLDDLLQAAARLTLRLAPRCEWVEGCKNTAEPHDPDSWDSLYERIRALMTAYADRPEGRDGKATLMTRFAGSVADQIVKVPALRAAVAAHLASTQDNDPRPHQGTHTASEP